MGPAGFIGHTRHLVALSLDSGGLQGGGWNPLHSYQERGCGETAEFPLAGSVAPLLCSPLGPRHLKLDLSVAGASGSLGPRPPQ